jgi:hypothetical protein
MTSLQVQARTPPTRVSQYHQPNGALRKIDGHGEVAGAARHAMNGDGWGGQGRVYYPAFSLTRMFSAGFASTPARAAFSL